jgi:hypothetical protein
MMLGCVSNDAPERVSNRRSRSVAGTASPARSSEAATREVLEHAWLADLRPGRNGVARGRSSRSRPRMGGQRGSAPGELADRDPAAGARDGRYRCERGREVGGELEHALNAVSKSKPHLTAAAASRVCAGRRQRVDGGDALRASPWIGALARRAAATSARRTAVACEQPPHPVGEPPVRIARQQAFRRRSAADRSGAGRSRALGGVRAFQLAGGSSSGCQGRLKCGPPAPVEMWTTCAG